MDAETFKEFTSHEWHIGVVVSFSNFLELIITADLRMIFLLSFPRSQLCRPTRKEA